jgi:hypothetical protein
MSAGSDEGRSLWGRLFHCRYRDVRRLGYLSVVIANGALVEAAATVTHGGFVAANAFAARKIYRCI